MDPWQVQKGLLLERMRPLLSTVHEVHTIFALRTIITHPVA